MKIVKYSNGEKRSESENKRYNMNLGTDRERGNAKNNPGSMCASESMHKPPQCLVLQASTSLN